MNCLVTAGPTYEPLDEVRRLTNFSTGRLGAEFASFLEARGHVVTLLIGESATWPGGRGVAQVEIFSTTQDLRRRLKAHAARHLGAVFHAAAVSDFTFGRMFSRDPAGHLKPFQPSRKISTRRGGPLVELLPTAKIIAELRTWYPRALVVGWKYEADGARADAVLAARKQIAECATNACVANGPAYGEGFGLITPENRRHYRDRAGLYQALAKLLDRH
jgi:phosphopantothenoylcysteine decarboxylase/phosphopantothenate--cysteine ligase